MNHTGQQLRRYGDLVSSEVEEGLREERLILPVGAIEQHGPHLPLTVDIDIANALASEIAERLGGYLAPTITYGARSLPQSGGGPSFPGTIAVRGTTLIEYFTDVLTAYVRCGARSLVVVNGHYENEPFLFESMEVCRESGRLDGVEVISLSWWSVVTQDFVAKLFSGAFPGWHAEHAGLCETSLMLYLRPEVVRAERPQHSRPPLAGVYLHPIDPEQISDRGVLAQTAGSSAEIGRTLFEHVSSELERLVRNPHGLARK
ncbi:MAG: creatininase [Acidobacteriota bacterium]